MWQFVTVPTAKSNRTNGHKQIAVVTHGLTHRRYRFRVLRCAQLPPEHANGHDGASDRAPRRWVTLRELDKFPLPRPHVKIAQMLRAEESR